MTTEQPICAQCRRPVVADDCVMAVVTDRDGRQWAEPWHLRCDAAVFGQVADLPAALRDAVAAVVEQAERGA